MEDKKPSTADILAKIRAQKAAAAAALPAEAAAEAPAPVATPSPQAAASAPEVVVTPVVVTPAVKPAAPAAKPGSTKDIMAAIRAGGAKPEAATPAAAVTPAPATSAPVVVATAAPISAAPVSGPKLSPQEMLQKMRDAKAAAAAGAAPAQAIAAPAAAVKQAAPVAAPPMPVKPVPVSKAAKPSAEKRGLAGLTTVATVSVTCFVLGFLTGSNLFIGAGVLAWALLMSPFAAAWTSIAGITGIWTLGTARFMFPNVLVEPPSKFKIGPLSDYPINTVSNKWKDQFGVWIVHTDQYEGRNMIFALTSVCTHLGCTPNWLDGEQKFKCPCHGSGFYMTGVNFEGPAPRPLERAGLRVAEDGMLEVNKSVKFQEEMGQWIDSTSFVEIA